MGEVRGDRQRTSSDASVWGAQSPFLMDLYRRGRRNYRRFKPERGMYDQAQQAWQQQLNPQMNPHLDAMTAQFQEGLGRLDNQTGMGAVAGGLYGGGRQGVEQALNQQNAGNQLGNFLGAQYQADMNRAQSALGMTGQVMGLSPAMQRNRMLTGYGNLIGRPTVLSQSRGRQDSFGVGK